jgi:hypothetical protein
VRVIYRHASNWNMPIVLVVVVVVVVVAEIVNLWYSSFKRPLPGMEALLLAARYYAVFENAS